MQNFVQSLAMDHRGSRIAPERAHELERRLGTWTPAELAQNQKFWAHPEKAHIAQGLGWSKLKPLHERVADHEGRWARMDDHDRDVELNHPGLTDPKRGFGPHPGLGRVVGFRTLE